VTRQPARERGNPVEYSEATKNNEKENNSHNLFLLYRLFFGGKCLGG